MGNFFVSKLPKNIPTKCTIVFRCNNSQQRKNILQFLSSVNTIFHLHQNASAGWHIPRVGKTKITVTW